MRALAHRHRAALPQQRADAILLGDKPVKQVGMITFDRLGGEPGAPLQITLRAEDLQIGHQACGRAGRVRLADTLGEFLILLRSLRQRIDRFSPFRGRDQ